MIRTQIYLTVRQKTSLAALSAATGKAQSELIREAIDHLVAQHSPARREAVFARAAGMWKDHRDLSDFPGAAHAVGSRPAKMKNPLPALLEWLE
jgi:hypothetical protein